MDNGVTSTNSSCDGLDAERQSVGTHANDMTLKDIAQTLPKGAFAESFFVHGWNSFIQFAALSVTLSWLKSAA